MRLLSEFALSTFLLNVDVSQTTKDPEVRDIGYSTVPQFDRRLPLSATKWLAVVNVVSGLDGQLPESRGQASAVSHGLSLGYDGLLPPFCSTVLLWRHGDRRLTFNSMLAQIRGKLVSHKLPSSIRAETLQLGVELSLSPGLE